MSSAAVQDPTEETETESISPEGIESEETTSTGKNGSEDSVRRVSYDLLRRQMAHCGEYTFQALNKIGKLSPQDTSRITQKYLKVLNSCEKGKPFPDALNYLVIHGWKKNEVEARDVTLAITKALLRYSKTKVSHLAFAHQTETPIEFYNAFPGVSEICRLLGSPIIQVSEKDFVSVTSVNPYTATAAAGLISNEIEAEVGRKPFQFITTTDLNAWKYTCERHFGT
ncbi:MAG: hypothetical protein P1U58_04120 [Verrucomicrobiales bacterium]|nr:hypothetical protein [Verrucomicrobiales bacterium]